MEERTLGIKGSGKNEGKGQEQGGKGETRKCWTCGKTGHIAAWCRKGGNKNLYARDEDGSENAEESVENEEDLQAWCKLEESENEQWKEVNQASLLSVESSHSLSPMKIVEVKHKRGSSEVHNIQKCECCQTLHFNAKGRPSWKHCGAG